MPNISEQAMIADHTQIPADVSIGAFSVVQEEVRLAADVRIGVGCVLERGVQIAAGCRLGHYVILGVGVCLGENCRVEDHSVIYAGTLLEEECVIGSHASLGKRPQAAATSTLTVQDDLPALSIGAGTVVGCGAVLYAGTHYGRKVFIGDAARVREGCRIGDYVLIGGGVAVENDTRIGAYTKIQTGSYITAHMEIAERVFIAPMVTTTNDNYMGRTEKRLKLIQGARIARGARIGGGSILLPRVHVAEETFVAAGALVTKDTQAGRVVQGVPARDIRAVPLEEKLPPK
ncbi:MAG: transferase [Peptococcaceae bacterium]|jgi:UDP-3-O-[3-hydroxymyristoyl] glucosamine N-acyltransferase|nr:transferase [Peptococcaceae bacterium]